MDARTNFLIENADYIRNIARRRGIPFDDLDDFVQDVYLASMINKESFDSSKGSIRTYSAGFVILVVREWRKKRRLTFDEIAVGNKAYRIAGPEMDVEKIWDSLEKKLQAVNRPLTERQLQIFRLLRSGKSKVEIARLLGISKAAVSNCTKAIREKYEGMGKTRGREDCSQGG